MEGDFLKVCVADDGPGYPDDMLVNPGHLVENAEVRNGGTHLGLYFAEKIAACHKQGDKTGYIKLNNKGVLGGGEFNIYIP